MSIVSMLRSRRSELLFLFIVLLAVSLGFSLGYYAARGETRAPIVIEKCSE